MDHKNNLKLEWSLWLNWVVATTLGFLINDGSQLFLANGSILAFVYELVLDGLVLALLQWLFVLRYLLPNARQWIFVGTLGWGAGWFSGQFSGSLIFALLIHGIILGMIQWAFFVRRIYARSILWVVATAIGLPFAYGLSWFVIFPLLLENYSGPFSGQLDSAIRGFLFGAITGIVLLWLSRLPQREMDTVTISNP